MRISVIAFAGLFVLAHAAHLGAQSALKGSRTTMQRQNEVAQRQDYTFLRTTSDVHRFAEKGYLVQVRNTSTLKLADVSFPYARPAVKTFAERLATQYHNACGNKLVVTSLTRPISRQPQNASDLSVHPAGMALDIRISDRRSCRTWLENTLISLEKRGVIDATRERNPAHYHVAVFPAAYERYVAGLTRSPGPRLAAKPTPDTPATASPRIAKAPEPSYASIVPLPSGSKPETHKVRSGETLWAIARKHGVSVAALKSANDLNSSTIKAGQILAIPRARTSEAD